MVIYFHRHTTILTSTLSFIWDTEINILHFFFFFPSPSMAPCFLQFAMYVTWMFLESWFNLPRQSNISFISISLPCNEWMPRCNNLNGALLKIECGNRWSSCVSPMICLLLQKVKVTQNFIYLGKNKLGM